MNVVREAAIAAAVALLLPGAVLAAQDQAAPPPAQQPQQPQQTSPAPPPAAAGGAAGATGTPTDSSAAAAPPITAVPAPGNAGASGADLGAETPQPSAATPPTPLPKKGPDTRVVGVTDKDIHPATLFSNGAVPGQPLPSDLKEIHTLQDALTVAFSRSPSVLQAQEKAIQTKDQVRQILAVRQPSVSASGTYARLGNASSSASVPAGASLSQLSNPFGVGLSVTPPGSTPVQLSTSSGTSGGAGGTSTAATTTSTSAAATSTGDSATSTVGRDVVATVPASNAVRAANDAAATSRATSSNSSSNSNAFSINLNQASARISVSQLVDITGVVRTAIQVGDLEEALSRLELARTRQQTALSVTNAYYAVLRANAFVTVNESAVTDDIELLRVTQAQLNAGVAAQFDVLRAQTQLDNDRQALISSRNQVAIAKNNLANQIGIDPSTPVDAQTVDVPPLPTLDEEGLIQTAFNQRPEYIEADVNLIVADKSIRLAHRNLEPYLNVGASAAYDATPTPGSANNTTGSVGVTLNIPLYDGGATRAEVDSARSDQRTALVQKDQFARGIKAEVQQAVIAVRDASDRSKSTGATVTEARESLRLANVRYKAGVGTQLDVYNAESALVQAESNQVNATYDYLGALASLARAIGTPA